MLQAIYHHLHRLQFWLQPAVKQIDLLCKHGQIKRGAVNQLHLGLSYYVSSNGTPLTYPMALVWFVDKFPRSRKPVQYRRLDDIVSFYSTVDRLKRQQEPNRGRENHNQSKVICLIILNKKNN